MSRSDRAWSGSCAVLRAILRGEGALGARHRFGARHRIAVSLLRLSFRRQATPGSNWMGRFLWRGALRWGELVAAVVLVLALISGISLISAGDPTHPSPTQASPTQASPTQASPTQADPLFAGRQLVDVGGVDAGRYFAGVTRRPRGGAHPHRRTRGSRARRPGRVADRGLRAVTLLAPGSGYLTGGSGAVRGLQRRLSAAGCAPGPIDGLYGPITERAVACFQAGHGLVVDGIAGPLTLAALQASLYPLAPGAGYQLPEGSGAVRTLQRRLKSVGFPPGPIDGRYGPMTTRAVSRFQHTHQLPVNGIADVHVQRVLTRARQAQRRTALERSRRKPSTPIRSGPRVAPEPTARPHRTSTRASHRAVATRGHAPTSPPAPAGLVLVAMAFLGLVTVAVSYGQAHSRLKRRHHAGASPGPPAWRRELSLARARRFGSTDPDNGVDWSER